MDIDGEVRPQPRRKLNKSSRLSQLAGKHCVESVGCAFEPWFSKFVSTFQEFQRRTFRCGYEAHVTTNRSNKHQRLSNQQANSQPVVSLNSLKLRGYFSKP